MWHALRYAFFLLVVRPIIILVIGLNVRRRELLPTEGPAIVVANHNSHLDTAVLMTTFGMKRLRIVRPVAAADYFLANRWLAWFALRIIGIIPIDRKPRADHGDALARISAAIERREILILFPEGTRGAPEQLEEFKSGIAHIAKRHGDVRVTPVFLHGLGKALPAGEALLVPFFCDVFVGDSFAWTGDRSSFMRELNDRMKALAAEGHFPDWS